jgi:threonine aldolase
VIARRRDQNAGMPESIELRSDNAAGVAPEILAAVVAANTGSALAYGGDDWSTRLRERVADVFEHPDVAVFPVTTGTAANALGLSALCPPWGAVLCHETAHIIRNEAGATSMFGAGAVMRGLPGPDFKLTPASVEAAFADTWWGDPHHSQPSVVSLTCPTDYGTVYAPAEVAALAAVARARGVRVHLDGARIANAVAALGCTPAELTWRAGVDVLSLGATKNGALSTDAVVCFDPAVAEQLLYRVKRAGHVASKMRYQAVQLDTYLTDGLWLTMAATANRAMGIVAAGLRALGVELLAEPHANMAFVRLPGPVVTRLAENLHFYDMGGGVVRFVTSFQTTEDDAHEVVRRVGAALS